MLLWSEALLHHLSPGGDSEVGEALTGWPLAEVAALGQQVNKITV
jgi:hypothetical protein